MQIGIVNTKNKGPLAHLFNFLFSKSEKIFSLKFIHSFLESLAIDLME